MNIQRRIAQLLTVCTALFAAANTQGMFLDRVIVDIGPDKDKQRQDVRITNDQTDNLYLKVEVFEVQNPGTDKESRELIKKPPEAGLLVTPSKMVIPPNSSKLLRLVNIEKNSDKERVFRINVTPILPPLAEETEQSQVRVVVAYQVLVLVAPNPVTQDLKLDIKGEKATFVNSGNAYVYLVNGEQCKTAAKKECQQLPPKRLYPGNKFEVTLPFARQPFQYGLQTVKGNEQRVFGEK